LFASDDRRQLVRVLRAMGRHRIFHEAPVTESDHESRTALLHYMEEHFTGDDIQRIASSALRVARICEPADARAIRLVAVVGGGPRVR
jgi:hypothetical protein